jgi:hypothetical protein
MRWWWWPTSMWPWLAPHGRRSWPPPPHPQSIFSWVELYHQFIANFERSYLQPGVEVDLHVVHQHKGDATLFHSMLLPGVKHHSLHHSNFYHCCISAGVWHKKILEKLATHDVSEVFSLAHKCTRAAKEQTWHTYVFQQANSSTTEPPPQPGGQKE